MKIKLVLHISSANVSKSTHKTWALSTLSRHVSPSLFLCINTMQLFRTDISPAEEQEFRQWARENYTPFEMITGLWHPIVQDECRIMNEEASITCEELSRD